MEKEKGRSVAVMDRSKYTEECLHIFQTEQFTKLRHDLTKSIKNKIQRELKKFKTRLTIQQYRQLYHKDSTPDIFYGNPKLHKLPPYGTIEELPIRPISLSIGTTNYRLVKYLAMKSTFDLMGKIKNQQIPLGITMISSDVKSLFTSVPLTETIDIILNCFYNRKEISTVLTKNEMKSR